MRVDELDYPLPQHLIGRRPHPQRDGSRLLVVHPDRHEHLRFSSIVERLPRGALLIVNDTRVIPARLLGTKPTGGKVELLLVRRVPGEADAWRAMGRASKALRPRQMLQFGESLRADVLQGPDADGLLAVRLSSDQGENVDTLIENNGQVPLPPYLERPADADDRERYQTVYAEHPGAVAAPTAGLHFTRALLDTARERGCEVLAVTLHVGPGTFRPVYSDDLADHPMHAEEIDIRPEIAVRINKARREGRAIVAVGTTVVRTLESATSEGGELGARSGQTDLLIQPGYRFKVVDALITNFHLPRSTLLALVFALGGTERVRRAYEIAVERAYRFYSYGDAMYLTPETCRRGGQS